MTREITVPEIATSNVQGVVRRLQNAGYRLADEIHDDILALGQPAIPALLEILEDAVSKSPVGGWGPAHAAQLLGELHATAAVEPMLQVLAGTDTQDHRLHDNIMQSLAEIDGATEAMIRAYVNNTDPTFRYSISTALAERQVHDDRILEILIDQLRCEPSRGAGNLAVYGDARAIAHLLEALDQYTIVETKSPFANHALVELRAAIEELGGTLTAEQQRKCRRGRRSAEAFSRELDALLESHRREVTVVPAGRKKLVMPAAPVRRERQPGRNEPCWCGSARKYKRCHLATDENARGGSR